MVSYLTMTVKSWLDSLKTAEILRAYGYVFVLIRRGSGGMWVLYGYRMQKMCRWREAEKCKLIYEFMAW